MVNKVLDRSSCIICLVLGIVSYAPAAEVKLNSNDGSTGFIVRNSAAAAVFSADSGGNTVISGTATIAGPGFSVGGATLTVKAGRVGIGTAAPAAALDVNGGVRVGNYVSASTPSPAGIAGTFIFNTVIGKPYVSDGTGWKPLGALSAPGVGGAWLLVPGNSALGTQDFYVQKYEAKNVGGVPTAEPAGAPWVSISQTAAKTACTALGPGYHLLRMEEAQTISWNIENTGWNWTGGTVGSGSLWRGHTDNAPASALAADTTGDPDDDPYVGTGNTIPSIERRVHQLSSGKTIWDWSGNVWEWVDMTCVGGTGVGLWDATAAWQEWSVAALSDYEKGRAGPAGAYTSVQNAGRYYGCTATGNAVLRGGYWADGAIAGVFAFRAYSAPSVVAAVFGFRCGR